MKRRKLVLFALIAFIFQTGYSADRYEVVKTDETCTKVFLEARPMADAPAASGTVKYQWYKDGEQISGANQSTYVAKELGEYNCQINDKTFTTTSYVIDCGQYGYQVVFEDKNNPHPWEEEDVACYEDPIKLTVNRWVSGDTVQKKGTTFQWYKLDEDGDTIPITGATSATYDATTAGTYTCVVTEEGTTEKGLTCTTITIGSKEYPWLFDNGEADDGDHNWFDEKNWWPNRNRIPNIKSNATIKENRIAWVGKDTVANQGVAQTKTLEMRDGSGLVIKPEGRMAIDSIIYYKVYNGTDELVFSKYYDKQDFSPIEGVENYPVAITIENNTSNQGAITIKEDGILKAKTSLLGFATTSGYYDNNVDWQYMAIPVDNGKTAESNYSGAWITQWTEAVLAEDHKLGANWSYIVNNDRLNLFEGYALTQPSQTNYWMEGILPTSSKTIDKMTYTVADNYDYSGYHLIGNSYSAPIDVREMTEDDFNGVEATFYLFHTGTWNQWDGYREKEASEEQSAQTDQQIGVSAGQYMSIPIELAKSGEVADHLIPTQQGVFVMASASNASITFDYDRTVHQPNLAMRDSIKSNIAAPMAFAPKRKAKMSEMADERIYAQMTIYATTENYSDMAKIFLNDGCSDEFDNGWDGRKMSGSSYVPQIYFQSANGYWQYDVTDHIDGQEFSVMAGVETFTTLHFDVEGMKDICSEIYVTDLTSGDVVEIMANPEYSYMANGQGETRRFKLTAVAKQTGMVDNLEDSEIATPMTIGVYDILGRKVNENNIKGNTGVYIFVNEKGTKKEVIR